MKTYDRKTAPRRSETWSVYALVDSRDIYSVRYIGITNSPRDRLGMHYSQAKREGWKKSRWIQSVLAADASVLMWIFAEQLSQTDAKRMEISLIAGYRDLGFRLMNLTDGGDGVQGVKQSAETRAKKSAAMTGKKKSREQVERMRASKTGVKCSENAKRNMSESHLKRYADNPEQVERQRINNIIRFENLEERTRSSEAHRNSYVNNPEIKNKISQSLKEYYSDPIKREKISNANKKRAGKDQLKSTNSSGFRGVSFKKETGKWYAYISINGKRKHLGYFDTSMIAAVVYDLEALRVYGPGCYLNFPERKRA